MEKNNLNQLQEREQELEATLKNLREIIESRNNILNDFEKNVLRKITQHMFSNLNAGSRGGMISGMSIIKKNYELDIKLFRRCLFYLHKRKRNIEAELEAVKESIVKEEVAT